MGVGFGHYSGKGGQMDKHGGKDHPMVLLLFGTEIHIRGRIYTRVSRQSWKRMSELMQRMWKEHRADMMMIQGGFLYQLV